VAALARELGLAQNAVYWYFRSRDHLLVATMERMLAAIVARKPKRDDADEVERILWFTDQFQELSELRGAMRERARSSEVVARFLANLDETLSVMLSNALSGRVPADRLPLAVAAFRATADGTVARGLSDEERRRVLAYALERLIA
jgi:AcrR family transcriptional regulator